jgi:5,10-methylenetetrahydromethanopterin reductase
MKVGFATYPFAGATGDLARRIEDLGFDALSLADSPNLANDVYCELTLATVSTRTIELATGVTNSLTRHSSVTAGAIATLQAESNGRAVCGIGRGNTSAYQIGKRPDALENFERYVSELQAYLRGAFVAAGDRSSRLEWLDRFGLPKVPLEVAASGPKVLAIAARHADRISLAVGANAAFVESWLERARAEVRAAGRDPTSVQYGAYIPTLVNDDPVVAREAVRFVAGTFANLVVMPGQVDEQRLGEMPAPLVDARRAMRGGYDLAHGPAASASQLSDDFLDWFALVGRPGDAVEKLVGLAQAGLDYVFLVSGFHTLPRDVANANLENIGRLVLPAMREGATVKP